MISTAFMFSAVTMAAWSVPLTEPSDWQLLEYSNIPANSVQFSEEGMTVSVEASASPVIFPLQETTEVKSISVAGELNGGVTLPDDAVQGDKGLDDFTLRVGLVLKGDKRLGWLERRIAPKWVQTLYGLAPEGVGIEKIVFLAASQQQALVGSERVHPLSKLITEKFVWNLDQSGTFSFQTSLPEAQEVVAIWISSDGDDTKSSYQITYNEIILNP